MLRGHQLPVTCLVISPDDRFIFSASKDGSLIKCKCSPGAVTGCSQAQILQGVWVSTEVAWPLAILGLCIIPGSVEGSLTLLGVVGGSQRVIVMPFLQGRWTVGRGCAWCPGGRRARRSGTWGTPPTSFAWPSHRTASTWYGDRRWRDGHGECSPRVLGVESHAQMCLAGLKQPLPPAGSRMDPWDTQSP